MVSKVILSCVVFGFVLISCNGRHMSSHDRSLFEAEDMIGSLHKINSPGATHDKLREDRDSTFWMTRTSGTSRPMTIHYENQPGSESSSDNDETRSLHKISSPGATHDKLREDKDSTFWMTRTSATSRPTAMHYENQPGSESSRNNERRRNENLLSSDFKSSFASSDLDSDEQNNGPKRSNLKTHHHISRHSVHHHHGNLDENEYNPTEEPMKGYLRQKGSATESSYKAGRNINLVASQEQSRESSEGLQIEKVRHNTDPQQAGNARRKMNYMQSRGQESQDDANSSQEDVANKIYKKNN